MTSPPLDITHGRKRRAWHAITALGKHIQSDDVGQGMTSPPLDSTHSRTTPGVACHHRLWASFTINRGRAWHDISALGQHTWSNDVRCGMASSPLGSTNGQTTSGVERHHQPCTAHTAERRREWHDITTYGLHARSNDVEHGMT